MMDSIIFLDAILVINPLNYSSCTNALYIQMKIYIIFANGSGTELVLEQLVVAITVLNVQHAPSQNSKKCIAIPIPMS